MSEENMAELDFEIPDTTALKSSTCPIIWVLGGPGSGKGTQCDKIVGKYGFTHISTGDLLRADVASSSARGKALETVMKEGKLVSSKVVLGLLAEKMLAELPKAKGYLIDGYPRELEQGQQFESVVGMCKLVLYFQASDETLIKRLLHRALTSGREDDNEETIKKRLNTFHSHNDPIVNAYASKTVTLDGEKTPEEIFVQVVKAIDAVISK
ncbi:adenylate kinase isoenzyme 1 isoform X2 [Cimex lectularius]|uniref:Adenylate kinase n=1 Tax=Cimex lectularius TaxID=79782 RepID=A0A8I6SHN8_CIMLE|nr:adenylate kinase isoenzyme 1 isoform X2 [Cimex lectularius]